MSENLGQHFLTNESVVADIISAGEISKNDTVLEIGPGKGVLTERLLQKAGRVVAVEKDPELVKVLQEKFAAAIVGNALNITKGDIRDFDLKDLIGEDSYKVISNIPYYLTSELIRKLIQSGHQPECIVVLIQKEVAERITVKDGKHNRLSLFVHAYGQPELIKVVDKNALSPPPKVDSAILQVSDISSNFFNSIEPKAFFDLIRVGFQHKRKTIKNNLAHTYSQENTLQALDACKVEPQTRPERLSLANWRCLHKKLMS
jgi:16S rRNA (adenine1518-N6/adenine1519-N6)-dimethyltransferase